LTEINFYTKVALLKMVKISDEAHKALKKAAADKGMTMPELASVLITEALKKGQWEILVPWQPDWKPAA
jgi:hypothetical protein